MRILKYLYYRIYNTFGLTAAIAELGAFAYITIFLFVSTGLFYIVLEKILSKRILFDIMINLNPLILQISIFLLISIFSYYYFFKRDIGDYKVMFDSKTILNRSIKIWMISILPLILIVLTILIDISF